ncbi:MAG: ABC transporter permease [Treponema sp.]|nr:ABC transporter permease [Treponema sp.]MCL2181054.1 ABC transporter permease [Treponema sp.]
MNWGIINLSADTLSIIGVTLRMSFFSTLISTILGAAFGLLLEKHSFHGKKIVVRICRTLMGMPPVVAGLIIYLLLMRRGPLGFLGILFTVQAMVIAQVFLITPIITGMIYTYAARSAPSIRAFAKTMGAGRLQTYFLFIKEMSGEFYFVVVTAFARAISEVGAVMIVGGNIQHKTRTMTTAISMLRNMGDFSQGITLGILLLLIAFLLQTLSDFLRRNERNEENF